MTGRPKGTGGRAKALSRNEINRISKVLTDTRHELRDRALIFLGLGSGMRISEMVGLKVQDVAPRGSVLPTVVLEKHSTKAKKSREVSLSSQARKHLEEYLAPYQGRPYGSEWLFPGRLGRPLSPNSAVHIITRIFELAGITGASSHSLRRTHATELRRAGVDLKIIQEQLGHSSLSVTEAYLEVDPFEKQAAIEKLRF